MTFLTPEEIQRKRQIRKRLGYLLVPIIGALIGIITTLLMSAL